MERTIIGPVFHAARPNFLSLTPLCVLLGIAAALHSAGRVDIGESLLVLLAALLGHISVNLLNEYHDFRSGLDHLTVRTPFSGGSGSLPAHPEAAAAAGAAGAVALAGSVAIGLYFIAEKGWALLPLGLVGALVVVAYTPLITRQPLLCLLAPGLGFGPVMVGGSAFVLSGHYSWVGAVAALPPLLLVSELLLINQFPDVEADRQVGRRHLPIVLGRRRAAVLFGALLIATYLTIIGGVLASILPLPALLALLTLPAGLLLAVRVHTHADDTKRLLRYLGINVATIHLTLLLLAVGLLLG
ncbi:prenyltransferase [Algiphilus sp. W345]|uniref:Prenyltransferase n=1 Tax=Banduia mediterranea TaxID=3075609 RepID=A0ABU2WIZ4_9GAMM|nr:prenyltransferase [Algiphilus sp. W345]MDT0497841.1 prenyltransferase [Algiphilus sp. W345]